MIDDSEPIDTGASDDQHPPLGPEQSTAENMILGSKINELKIISESFPYVLSSEEIGDGNCWIVEGKLEHWKEDDENWGAQWGIMSTGQRMGGLPTQICIEGPMKDGSETLYKGPPYRFKISVNLDAVTFEDDPASESRNTFEAEQSPIFNEYRFLEDGRILKKDDSLPTPGDYETLGVAITQVQGALLAAKAPQDPS